MKIWISISFLICLQFEVLSQNSRIQKSTLKIGEQTEIYYELNLDSEYDAVRFEPKMRLITCDIVQKNSQLSSGQKVNIEIIGEFQDSLAYGKKIKWNGKYTITAWDTGYFEIPAPVIVWKDSMVSFQPIQFKVVPTKLIAGKELMESAPTFTEIPEDPLYWFKSNLWWMILLLVLGVLYWFYIRWKNKKPESIKREISLKDKTLFAIEALDNSKLWEKGMLKEHYIEMTYILRSYLGVRYELNLLESTSFQTKILLKHKGLSADTVETIQMILDQSDMVKFAKSLPTDIEILRISALAKQIVAETSPLEFDV